MTFSQEMSVLDHRKPPSKDSSARKHTTFTVSFSFFKSIKDGTFISCSFSAGLCLIVHGAFGWFFDYSYRKKMIYYLKDFHFLYFLFQPDFPHWQFLLRTWDLV